MDSLLKRMIKEFKHSDVSKVDLVEYVQNLYDEDSRGSIQEDNTMSIATQNNNNSEYEQKLSEFTQSPISVKRSRIPIEHQKNESNKIVGTSSKSNSSVKRDNNKNIKDFYSFGRMWQLNKQNENNSKKALKMQQEMNECTYSPQISGYAQQVTTNLHQNTLNSQIKKIRRMASLKKQQEIMNLQQEKNNTFRPEINKSSQNIPSKLFNDTVNSIRRRALVVAVEDNQQQQYQENMCQTPKVNKINKGKMSPKLNQYLQMSPFQRLSQRSNDFKKSSKLSFQDISSPCESTAICGASTSKNSKIKNFQLESLLSFEERQEIYNQKKCENQQKIQEEMTFDAYFKALKNSNKILSEKTWKNFLERNNQFIQEKQNKIFQMKNLIENQKNTRKNKKNRKNQRNFNDLIYTPIQNKQDKIQNQQILKQQSEDQIRAGYFRPQITEKGKNSLSKFNVFEEKLRIKELCKNYSSQKNVKNDNDECTYQPVIIQNQSSSSRKSKGNYSNSTFQSQQYITTCEDY